MSSKQNISVKVVIIGEPAVGKTTLRESFVGAGMQGDYLMTLGVDMAQAQIEINKNLNLDAQIWDIAGQDSLETITNQFLAGTQGAIFVFDLTREYTFEKINSWMDRLHAENPDLDNNIPFLIVGNKSDLEIHIKTNDEDVINYMDYVDRHHVYSKTPTEYIKTSAKTGAKVKEAFKRMGEIIVRNFQELDGTYVTPEVNHEKASKLEKSLVPAKFIEDDIQAETAEPEVVDISSLFPKSEPAQVTTPEPKPIESPAPTPMSTPAPIPMPIPEPEPVHVVTPEPKPIESPAPMSTPAPIPMPIPEPEPVHVVTPEPKPIESSAPTPMRIPAPRQEPNHAPQPAKVEKKAPVFERRPQTAFKPVATKPRSGVLSDEELAELIRQKDERKKKLFDKS